MGWMADAIGRKKALLVAALIALVGTALQAGSAAVAMFLVARWLTGYGVGERFAVSRMRPFADAAKEIS